MQIIDGKELTEDQLQAILFKQRLLWGDVGAAIVANHLKLIAAKIDNQIVGAAALVKSDLPTEPFLTPWLAGVYVQEEYRGLGYATKLVNAIVEVAANHGFPRIHLFTENAQTIYTRLGWKFVKSAMYAGKPITVMQKKL